ncbi:hypothetical protein GE21DRAFT_1110956 [Neurospora crassa]|nr:hypothetical protein GE21DRAFT_1110956 [Neurospora crassa]
MRKKNRNKFPPQKISHVHRPPEPLHRRGIKPLPPSHLLGFSFSLFFFFMSTILQ